MIGTPSAWLTTLLFVLLSIGSLSVGTAAESDDPSPAPHEKRDRADGDPDDARGPTPKPAEPSRTTYAADPLGSVTVLATTTNGFIHPGIGFTKEMLENARAQVRAKREPWYTGFQRFAASPESGRGVICRNQSRNDPIRPDVDALADRSIVGRLDIDGRRAFNQALMYFFTGEIVYRENGMRIVRVWSNLDPTKCKAFQECYIHASGPFLTMVQAAELLRSTSSTKRELAWTDDDTTRFSNNLVIPALANLFDTNTHFMNQDGFPKMATIAGNIFTNDKVGYAKRVEMFTVNKDAADQGSCFSIKRLARLVTTDDRTGLAVEKPQVQLMEMGRDQAHAGDDLTIFTTVARMLNCQGTKLDPAEGTISAKANAVGVYEFLDDRILAASDYFFRFMLGYDTPWIPVGYVITSGQIKEVYPRLSDNYRGRIRQFRYWDVFYYYTYTRGIDLAKRAPYLSEAFAKRINELDTDWIAIPSNVSGVGAKPMSQPRVAGALNLDQHATSLDGASQVVRDTDGSFLRVRPTKDGARIAILGCKTAKKVFQLRIRTNQVLELRLSGLSKVWMFPNTNQQWRLITYTREESERLDDIAFGTITGPAGSSVDLDHLTVELDANPAPEFTLGNQELRLVTAVGLPTTLDLSAKTASTPATIEGWNLPTNARLGKTGDFQWTAKQAGHTEFCVAASAKEFVSAKKVVLTILPDRAAAVRTITAVRDPKVAYVADTLIALERASKQATETAETASDRDFAATLLTLQTAATNLQPLTPLLPDGSMDFPRMAMSPTIGVNLPLLTDGNGDTFHGFGRLGDAGHTLDFGERFRFCVTVVAIQGRLNFADRAHGIIFSGSNDGKTWTQLAPRLETIPVEMTRIEIDEKYRTERFRYLNIKKMGKSGPYCEYSEIRLFGQRVEATMP